MVLILTNSEDATADHLTPSLDRASIPYIRLDTDRMLSNLQFSFQSSEPTLHVQTGRYTPDDIRAIWYRRPERLRAPHPQNTPEEDYALDEWSEALEGFLAHVPQERWINHPSANAGASHKVEQLTTAVRLGLRVPATLVTQNPEELRTFFGQHGGKVIAKPLSKGTLEDESTNSVSLIYTSRVVEGDLLRLDDLVTCPTLFQERLDKAFDVRITIVDEAIHAVKLFATESDGSQRCDIRRNNMEDVRYEACILPSAIQQKLLDIVAHYHLRFAAIDMAVTNTGDWIYFEINPNGQWAWLDTCAGLDIADSFVRSFQS